MKKRSPEQFLKEEGITVEAAKRIYRNIIDFIFENPNIGCLNSISAMKIIQHCITCGTDHAGGTSAMQFLHDIDEPQGSINLDNCIDTDHCEAVGCCYIDECHKYQKKNKEVFDELCI